MGGIFRADRHIHVKKGGVHLLNKEIRELLPERLRGLVERVAVSYTHLEIDAFFCTAGTKTTIIEELAKECPIRLLSLNETCLKKLMASSPMVVTSLSCPV